jgi:hypothetical protein
VAKWIRKRYMFINECSSFLCRGFSHRNIDPKYQEASLDAHLFAEVCDVKHFSNMTGWFIRYSKAFEIFKEIAILDT